MRMLNIESLHCIYQVKETEIKELQGQYFKAISMDLIDDEEYGEVVENILLKTEKIIGKNIKFKPRQLNKIR